MIRPVVEKEAEMGQCNRVLPSFRPRTAEHHGGPSASDVTCVQDVRLPRQGTVSASNLRRSGLSQAPRCCGLGGGWGVRSSRSLG